MSSSDKHMTAAERIQALCDEALKKPEITVTEKMLETPVPALVAPSTSRLKVEAAAAAAEEPVAVAEEKPVTQSTGSSVPQHHTEQDADLAAMLEEREQKLNNRRKRVRVVANVMLLLLVVTPVTVVAVNPELRGKFEVFVQHLGEGVNDVKSIGSTKENFDKALEKVAVRGDHINNATVMMGVDPNSVSEDDDLEMTAEMTAFMGEEADGFQTRKANLNKMGFFAKKVASATGMDKEEELSQ